MLQAFQPWPRSGDSASSRPIMSCRPPGGQDPDLPGGPARVLRGRATLLQRGPRPVREGLGYEVLDPWTLTDARPDPGRPVAAVRAREARGVADAQPRDGRDQPGGDRRGAGRRGRPRRHRRRQRHRRRDRLRVRARQAHRRLPGRLPPERRQRGQHVNLQVEYFIRASGGTIVERYEDLGPSLGSPALAGPRRRARARARRPARRSTESKMIGGGAGSILGPMWMSVTGGTA